ncbi:Uncharacterized protein dnm_083180 [Desulfonema magnum]|uniref:Uncharacterized protein n=1 Tax=Desulfonema magnum TaxID=45655 RepID=A0A975BVP8_9BACT|nr:Uncharacterized protein dnm_083180 [Desulfonema magnum]
MLFAGRSCKPRPRQNNAEISLLSKRIIIILIITDLGEGTTS